MCPSPGGSPVYDGDPDAPADPVRALEQAGELCCELAKAADAPTVASVLVRHALALAGVRRAAVLAGGGGERHPLRTLFDSHPGDGEDGEDGEDGATAAALAEPAREGGTEDGDAAAAAVQEPLAIPLARGAEEGGALLVWSHDGARVANGQRAWLRLAAAIAGQALDRVSAEQARAAEGSAAESRLAQIIGSAMDAVVTVDSRQRIVLFNAAAERVFGVAAADALGTPLDRFVPQRFRGRHAADVEEFGRTGASDRRMGRPLSAAALEHDGTVSALRADGSEFPAEAAISQAVVDGERFFTVVLRDVGERVRAQCAEAEARATAESSARRSARLHAVAAALSRALTPAAVARAVLEDGILALRAAAGVVMRVADDGHLEFLNSLGFPEDGHNVSARLDRGELLAMPEAVRTARTVVARNNAEWAQRFPGPGSLRLLPGVRSIAAVPMIVAGAVVGVICMVFRREDPLDPDDRDFASALAELAGQALERARLHEAEGEAHSALQDLAVQLEEQAMELEIALDEARRVNQELVERSEETDLERRRLSAVFDALPLGVTLCDAQGGIVQRNAASRSLWEGAPSITAIAEYEAIHGWFSTGVKLEPHDWPVAKALLWGETVIDDLLEVEGFDARRRTLLCSAAPVRDARGELVGAVSVVQDVTERKSLELQLLQSQKMEAVGRLAGGIAHDFNNLLTVILGTAQLLMADLEEGQPQRDDAQEIWRAAGRAAELTQQLLVFSRRHVVRMGEVDVNALLADSSRMLRRLIGEDVALRLQPHPQPLRVFADAAQVEQAVVNLVVNARDAMPHGGTLTIATAAATLSAHELGDPAAQPGAYVVITVEDTGTGIAPEVLPHVFEPFFTTKPAGQGTGLGLATVYGTARQCGGFVAVRSTPGQGTRFAVHLPALRADQAARAAPDRGPVCGGTETVLLVEDEDGVRRLARRALEGKGYRVLEAANAAQATALAEAYAGPVHLLLTDVVMPGQSGPDLAAALASRLPGVAVVFMSGYTSQKQFGGEFWQGDGVHLLEKPFSPDDVARAVRKALDGAAAAQPGAPA